MVDAIGSMISDIFYAGKTVNGQDTLMGCRIRSRAIQKYFQKRFKVNSPLMPLKTKGESQRDQTRLQFNPTNMAVVIKLAIHVIIAGVLKPDEITILTFYRAQRKLYRQQLRSLSPGQPKLMNIRF